MHSLKNWIESNMTSQRHIKKAFEDGKKAYLEGKPSQLPSSNFTDEEKKSWYTGYYETMLVQKHQKTFEKYGIKFP